MTHEQFENAVQYWNKKEQVKMPKEALKSAIDAYVMENNTCALATGTGDYVRCTPIEMEVLCSEFKKEGYSSRQTYEC